MIAYNNILRAATVSSEDTASGYPFSNALTGRTSEQVGFASGASRVVVLDCGAAVACSVLCVAWHNLGSTGASIAVDGSADDVTYYPITTKAFADDNVTFHAFTEASYRYYKLTISGHGGTAYVGDVFLGGVLDLPFGPDVGWTQPHQSFEDDVIANVTGTGALAGISVVTKPKEAVIQLRDFERSWFDANWSALLSVLSQYPVYYLWNTGERPIYGAMTKISAPKFTTPTRQSAQIDLMGLV